MAKITLEIPDDLGEKLSVIGDRLPEFLALSLEQPPLPAKIYQYIVNFLASGPTPEEIREFRPTTEMIERLQTLLNRSKEGILTLNEEQELREYERIEHLIILLKANSISNIQTVINE
jgi:hypothetical protein